MIRGLDRFREHFAEYKKSFVLIGGVACHEWLSTQELEFRATKDIDMVLIVEALDAAFVKHFWEFIEAGKYQGRFKAADGRQLYRFDKPQDENYPTMIETFSRKPDNIDLGKGQHIIPIKLEVDSGSLSAILLNDDYYALIRNQHNEVKDLPFVNPTALIPLKALAHLDLAERARRGEKVKGDDIAKHRTDVFRIAGTLPDEAGPDIPAAIQDDLRRFLAVFPPENEEQWKAIRDGLKNTFGGTAINPDALIGAIRKYFKL